MFQYEKRLQFPVKITKPCPKTASLIISQFGGPDGELAASMQPPVSKSGLSHRMKKLIELAEKIKQPDE